MTVRFFETDQMPIYWKLGASTSECKYLSIGVVPLIHNPYEASVQLPLFSSTPPCHPPPGKTVQLSSPSTSHLHIFQRRNLSRSSMALWMNWSRRPSLKRILSNSKWSEYVVVLTRISFHCLDLAYPKRRAWQLPRCLRPPEAEASCLPRLGV